MPWSASVESQRREFIGAFTAPGANRAAVCAAWGISRQAGYALLRRYGEQGEAALRGVSKRPSRSPAKTSAEAEAAILAMRDAEPSWGGRKLRQLLLKRGLEGVPAASTITEILRRNGRLEAGESQKRKAWVRFEREQPNELWQMDFKGHFALADATRCHPLTLLDDHSRYCVGLEACGNEQGETVRRCLERIFSRYGLPEAMLMDNGSPWGNDAVHVYTGLVAWLIRLDIQVLHGRPRHPQTQGKEERFHRTLDDDVLKRGLLQDLSDAQRTFDAYRPKYNQVRPHEALDLEVPQSRYRPSERALPARLPEAQYEEADEVRRVQAGGWISYRGREWRLSKAFRGERVALRESGEEGKVAVYFYRQRIAVVDLRDRIVRPSR